MKISEHITYEEAVYSAKAAAKGLTNIPNDEQLNNMKLVAERCFEPVRNWWGRPIKINSFFRSKEVNILVGGAINSQGKSISQHTKGEAIDMTAGSKEDNKKIFEWCKANLIYDQILWEFGDDSGPDWVHISFRKNANRNQSIRIK